MGSHPCLPRPLVYGSLEPTARSMKLVLDVCSLVEKVSLRVYVTGIRWIGDLTNTFNAQVRKGS